MDTFISILVLILAPLGMLVCLELDIADEVAQSMPDLRTAARTADRRAMADKTGLHLVISFLGMCAAGAIAAVIAACCVSHLVLLEERRPRA